MVNNFREALRDCDIIDLRNTRYPFTWSNRRFGSNIIEEKLDRFLCNSSWWNCYQEKTVVNPTSQNSNHSPILMDIIEKRNGQRYSKRTYPMIHYEDMRSPYEKCREIVKHEWKEVSCWNRGNPIQSFKRKSRESLVELKIQSNMEFKGREKKLKQLIDKLRVLKERYNHYKTWMRLKEQKIRLTAFCSMKKFIGSKDQGQIG